MCSIDIGIDVLTSIWYAILAYYKQQSCLKLGLNLYVKIGFPKIQSHRIQYLGTPTRIGAPAVT